MTASANSGKAVREEVLKLIHQKEQLENEIKELQSILIRNNIGMNESLVDDEGFPLSNVDVYQVRHARHLIICKQTDYKSIMKRIEQGISAYYENGSDDLNNQATNGQEEQMKEDKDALAYVEHTQPFATVNIVHPGSASDAAGIKQGDQIVEFGSINSSNFRSIDDIGIVVRHSHGNAINVKLKRGNRFLRVQLVPREWNGKGLLGCNVLPL